MKEKLILIFTLFFTFEIYGKDVSSVKITTMNIAWYGNTKFHSKDPDERDKVLKKFLASDLKSSDIILFQEITRPERFEQLLNSKYTCSAYDFRGNAHQYVLTCFDHTKFEMLNTSEELFDEDRLIPISIPRERLRDVLHVAIRCKKTNHIINTYNLHLKAGLNEAERREEQAEKLLESIEAQNISQDQTIILGGDFNSYIRNIDGTVVSEIENFLDLSESKGFDFYTVTDQPTTLAKTQKMFDFLMIDTSNKITDYEIHPICDRSDTAKNTLEDLEFFKSYISDHCPVSTDISLQ